VSNKLCASTGYDCGGGVFVKNSPVTLKDLIVTDNVAGRGAAEGGGIFLWEAGAVNIESTLVISNGAGFRGGGLLVSHQYQPMTITTTQFVNNWAGRGGGVHLNVGIGHLIEIADTLIKGNVALSGDGGGLFARLSQDDKLLLLNRVELAGNQADGRGKAIFLDAVGGGTPFAEMWNLLLSGNGATPGGQTGADDAVIAVVPNSANLTLKLAHVTAADNLAPSFLYARPGSDLGEGVQVILTNTLVSGFTNAFVASAGGSNPVTFHHDSSLLYDVTNKHVDLAGVNVFGEVNPVSGDPLLNGNYRLQGGSAAIDVGIDAGIATDIDGEDRPVGSAPDIGADEFATYRVYLPLVIK
jgi:hypothetical protein